MNICEICEICEICTIHICDSIYGIFDYDVFMVYLITPKEIACDPNPPM